MGITAPHPTFAMGDYYRQPSDGIVMRTCAFIVATMGLAPGQEFQWQQAAVPISLFKKSEVVANATISPKAGDFIATIKQRWQFNMTELAEILGVSRPTVYSWRDGKTSPPAEAFTHIQTLVAAGYFWEKETGGKNLDFLLDYTGPLANERSIRDYLKSADMNAEVLRGLIPFRIAECQEAYAEAKKLLGDPPPLPMASPPESAHRMNAAWAKNTKALHAARNRNS